MAENFYGLTGGCENALVRPVQTASFAATGTDADTITLGWDDSAADGDMEQIQYALGATGEGTVTTEAGINLVGNASNFTDFHVGDYVMVNGVVRQIATITSDTALTFTAAYPDIQAAAPFYVSGTWTDLVCLDLDVEAYLHESRAATTAYFYRLRIHKRLKWSDWGDVTAAVTTA